MSQHISPPARTLDDSPQSRAALSSNAGGESRAGDSLSARLSFCRKQQALYRSQNWPAAWTYRVLNAGFYLQLKRRMRAEKEQAVNSWRALCAVWDAPDPQAGAGSVGAAGGRS